MIPTTWYSCPCEISDHTVPELVPMTNRVQQITVLLCWIIKDTVASSSHWSCFPWEKPAGKSEEPYKEAHVIRSREDYSQEPARNWEFLPLAVWVKAGIPDPVKPQDECSTSQYLVCNLMRDSEPEPLSSATPKCLTLKNDEKYCILLFLAADFWNS